MKHLLLLLLIISSTSQVVVANDDLAEGREFLAVKIQYRHLRVSPLPVMHDGQLDVERLVVDSSLPRLDNLTLLQEEELARIISDLQANDDTAASSNWHSFIKEMKHDGKPTDVNALIQFVIKGAYLQQVQDLQFFASKVKFFNEQKKNIRDYLRDLRAQKSNLPECEPEEEDCPSPLGEALDTLIMKMEDDFESIGEDAQLANVDLQNLLQQQQQSLQQMSNISKILHDTTMAVVRKIAG